MSQRAYCFTHGNVSLSGESGALTRDAISAAYFGV
jgi:ABC-type branched-subunit amino acid transport system ATPase component